MKTNNSLNSKKILSDDSEHNSFEYNLDSETSDLERDSKKTYLHYCAEDTDYRNLKFALELGLNPNIQDDQGNTPLHIAIQNDMIKNIILLAIRFNTDFNLMNKKNQSAYNFLESYSWHSEKLKKIFTITDDQRREIYDKQDSDKHTTYCIEYDKGYKAIQKILENDTHQSNFFGFFKKTRFPKMRKKPNMEKRAESKKNIQNHIEFLLLYNLTETENKFLNSLISNISDHNIDNFKEIKRLTYDHIILTTNQQKTMSEPVYDLCKSIINTKDFISLDNLIGNLTPPPLSMLVNQVY